MLTRSVLDLICGSRAMALHSAFGPASGSCYRTCPVVPLHSAWAARLLPIVFRQSEPSWRMKWMLVLVRLGASSALETGFPGWRVVRSSYRLVLVAAGNEQSRTLSVEEEMY
jgi:hypothetical protein